MAEKRKKEEKLRKIKEKRKKKKRKMRTLLEEAVKIVFYKEEDNREIAYNKLKKKIGSARKVEKEKDFPIETTTWSVTAFFFKDLWKANVDKAAARKERIKK